MTNTNRAIYWDMDGTIADLYGVNGWLEALCNEDVAPYLDARPLRDVYGLYLVLESMRAQHFILGIVSWTSKSGSREYNKRTRIAKIQWLKENGLYDCFDEIHIVKYGTKKHSISKCKRGILIDDDATVRSQWQAHGGLAIDPNSISDFNLISEIANEWFD